MLVQMTQLVQKVVFHWNDVLRRDGVVKEPMILQSDALTTAYRPSMRHPVPPQHLDEGQPQDTNVKPQGLALQIGHV
jgi:hypothetical protein